MPKTNKRLRKELTDLSFRHHRAMTRIEAVQRAYRHSMQGGAIGYAELLEALIEMARYNDVGPITGGIEVPTAADTISATQRDTQDTIGSYDEFQRRYYGGSSSGTNPTNGIADAGGLNQSSR
jgi:hypothetical protein